jgi:hypothetical protein
VPDEKDHVAAEIHLVLAADLIRAALSENVRRNPDIPLVAIEVVDEIASTSTELLRRANRKDIHATVLAAEWQLMFYPKQD